MSQFKIKSEAIRDGADMAHQDNHTEQQPQAMVPRCQYCGNDPAPLIPAFTQIGRGKVTVFLCANPKCRAIHGVQLTEIMNVEPPLIMAP